MKSFYYTLALIPLAAVFLNGCSVLVGQVKPVEEKAQALKMMAIEQRHPEWKRLEIQSGTTSDNPDDVPDSAWQSSKTAAVISLTSACRKAADEELGLKEFTANLLTQWRNLEVESQRELSISGFPALETTAQGVYLNRARKFQTVVVKSKACLYEVVYLSPPKTFAQEVTVFREFRDSLNLK